MAKELTARQRQVFDALGDYQAERGYMPSIRELGRMLAIRSLRGVTIHLDALERKGWIERESTSRSIRIIHGEAPHGRAEYRSIPLLGSIAAGDPLQAIENVQSFIPLPAEIGGRSAQLYALKVHGDSMIGDHIIDGDTIVVQARPTAEHNEIVAVLIGDEATVKRLDLKAKVPRLLPSNPRYEPIELNREDVRILGKVVGLLRSVRAA